MNSYFIIVLLYLLILFILSAFVMKKALNSFEEYSYCSRSLSVAFVFFTYLGTWVGGGTIIGLVGRSYNYGAGQYWVIAMSCVIEIFFAFIFLPKIRENNYKSVPDFFMQKYPGYGGIVAIPVTAAMLIRNITMAAMQFAALSYLITLTFGINRSLAVLLVFLIIIAYTVLSGLWGVAITDVFQGLLQSFCVAALLYITFTLAGGSKGITSYYAGAHDFDNLNIFSVNSKPSDIVTYIIAFGLFFLMSDTVNWERIYAGKSDSQAKWSFIIPLVITLITLVLITYLGVFQRVVSCDISDSQSVLYSFILNSRSMKIMPVIMVGLIAAIMSSADSFLLASGVLISENVIKPFIVKDAGDREMIFYTRIFVVVTGAAAFAFALNNTDILSLWLTGIGITSIILLPGYFAGWINDKVRFNINTIGALLGMAAGIIYIVLMLCGMFDSDAPHICLGILLNLIVSFVFSRFHIKSSFGVSDSIE